MVSSRATFYTIYGAVCFQHACPFVFWWLWENVYFIHYHYETRSMNHWPLVRVRSWNNGLHCMLCYVIIVPANVLNAIVLGRPLSANYWQSNLTWLWQNQVINCVFPIVSWNTILKKYWWNSGRSFSSSRIKQNIYDFITNYPIDKCWYFAILL